MKSSNKTIPAKSPKKSTDDKSKNQIIRKWTPLIANSGWTAVPNLILEKQMELDLRPTEFNVLIQLMKFWWDKDGSCYPAKGLIANQMNVTPRTVQRAIAKLEKMGLVKRDPRIQPNVGQSSNDHDFSGLIEKLKPYAIESANKRKAPDRRKK